MKTLFAAVALTLVCQSLQAESLMSLYQSTMKSTPRIKTAQAEAQVGEARLDQATSSLLPQVNAVGTWSENQREMVEQNVGEHYRGEKYNLYLQQDLINFDKWHNRERHKYLSDEQQARLQGSVIEVSMDLVKRYLQALADQDALTLIEAERRATQKQLELLKKRYEKQMAKVTEVLEIEARLDGVLADEILAQARLEIALEYLSELVGRPATGSLSNLTDEVINIELAGLNQWLELAVANSPLLDSLLAKVRAAESGIKQAKAIDMPSVDLTLGAQKSDIGYESSQAALTETYYASVNLRIPLYHGGKGSAVKAENYALLTIAQQKYEEALRKTRRGVREAYLNTRAGLLRMSASKKAVNSATKSYAAQQKGLEFGTVTVVDVLDAMREELRFQSDFRQAQYDFINNWVMLLSLSGNFDQSNIETIDSWQSESEVVAR